MFAPGEREFLLMGTRRSRLRGEPYGGGDTVATADCLARFTPRSGRGPELCRCLCCYGVDGCLHGREGVAADTLAQAVGNTERESRLAPVTERGVGQRRRNSTDQQAPSVQELFEDSEAHPQDREAFGRAAFAT